MTARSEIHFVLNDRDIRLDNVAASATLLDFLHIDRRLSGTKEGCAEGDCGFCTPGFVMSLYALWMATPNPTEQEIETALQGNLCRCTGYEPIVKAALAATTLGSPADDALTRERDAIEMGACVSYSDSHAALTADYPHLAAFWGRIAGWQIRSMGTTTGNVANGSPIGDTPPVLIALGASITLRKGAVRRSMPIENFFIDHGKQDRAAGEFSKNLFRRFWLEQQDSDAAVRISA